MAPRFTTSNTQRRDVPTVVAALCAEEHRSHSLAILVVEHDPDHQWHLARTLTVRGHRVVGTSSPEGALALLSQWPVDVVFIDESLPGISGIELCKRFQQCQKGLPVVLMAKKESRVRRTASKVAGIIGTVTKPLHLGSLLDFLAPLQELAKPARAAATA